MNSRHRRTLEAVFRDPVSGTLAWADVEGLLLVAGARMIEGAAARGCASRRTARSRPSTVRIPRKEAKRYQVRAARAFPHQDRSGAMTSAMEHRGYRARVEYDDEDGLFTGRVAGIRDGVGFHADTVEGLRAAFREAVDDYLETCERLGRPPQKPYSGRLMLRVDPEVHRRAAVAAELAGVSLNQWAERALNGAAGDENEAA